jgi:hypothetical protein
LFRIQQVYLTDQSKIIVVQIVAVIYVVEISLCSVVPWCFALPHVESLVSRQEIGFGVKSLFLRPSHVGWFAEAAEEAHKKKRKEVPTQPQLADTPGDAAPSSKKKKKKKDSLEVAEQPAAEVLPEKKKKKKSKG